MELVIVLLAALPIFFFLMVLRGYVLSQLWLWFLVPMFKLPEITVFGAYGICLIFSFLIPSRYDFETDKQKLKTIIEGITFPFFVLLIGWIVKTWLL